MGRYTEEYKTQTVQCTSRMQSLALPTELNDLLLITSFTDIRNAVGCHLWH